MNTIVESTASEKIEKEIITLKIRRQRILFLWDKNFMKQRSWL